MRKLLTTLLFLLFIAGSAYSQALYYLAEDFETPETRNRWSQSPTGEVYEWEYSDGGQDGGFNPDYSFDGNYIAGLWRPGVDLVSMKLISPLMELADAKKPTLRFHHCQFSEDGPDYLSLYFRVGPNSPWVLIQQWTDELDVWTSEIYDIETIGTEYFTDTFQLAFEGLVGNGYGVYVDSVSVKEDAIVPRFVKRTTYRSVEHTVIPSGATNVPLEEVVIRTLGNEGSAFLDSLSVEPTGDGASLMVADSFKLWSTIGSSFSTVVADTSTLVAEGVWDNGVVHFADIGHELILGDNHLWITASFADTLSGETTVRLRVPANGINVSDTLYPESAEYFDENHLIKEAIFYDDFEDDNGDWTLETDFEIGVPEKVTVGIQTNPDAPYNGYQVLATNLNGGYLSNIGIGSEYYAYSPVWDLTYYIDPVLYLQSWFLINSADIGVIEYSIDGGSSWERIWTSSLSNNNAQWTEYLNETFKQVGKHQPSFQLRLGMVESETDPWPGFSVDNFALLAEKLHTDIGVVDIPSPFDECLECGNDTVKAWFRNYADGDAPSEIPVYYGMWGQDSIIVRDTIYGGIAKDDSVLFAFSQLADFPKGDYYDRFVVVVDLPTDQDAANDTLFKSLVIQNNYTSPNVEDFEYKGGIWRTQDTATWTAADMTGTIDPIDPETPNIWVLAATGNYGNNDSSWVTSNCYDFSDITRHIVKFNYWANTEAEKDGIRIEYTRDDGVTWNILDDPKYGAGWNWMPDTVEALKSRGWTGTAPWTSSKALLPIDIDTAQKTKFRVLFMSDATTSASQGFAFDNFELFPAPIDIGVTSIVAPYDTCQGINETTVSVHVENYGYNKLSASDTIIVGVDFEADAPVIDTLILTADLIPGDSIEFMVNTDIDILGAGTYNITAYTLSEFDPWYYQANNDTAHYSFDVWPNPTIMMPDTMGSRQPDTLVVVPDYGADWVPGYTYLWTPSSTPGGHLDSIYDVSASYGYGDTLYHLKVTEPVHGCSSVDSVEVLLLFSDAGVDSILSHNSDCEFTDSEIIEVRVKNFGTDSIYTVPGDTAYVVVGYQVVGDANVFRDTLTILDPIRSGKTITHEFTDYPYDFTEEKDYTIKAWAYFKGGDKEIINDSTQKNFSNYGYTPLSLGNDRVVQALDYTLDAGAGFDTYVWSNGVTTQTNYLDSDETNASGTYSVTATDANGCVSSGAVDVWFKIRDLQANTLNAPLSACELDRSGDSYVQFRVINNGTDTVPETDSIIFTYSINGGELIVDTAMPTNPIVPGAQYSYTFDVEGDFTAIMDYVVDLKVTSVGDLRPDNDTVSGGFSTKSNPTVDLGDYPDPISSLSFELDAGEGVYTYLWQDELTTSQFYTATNTGYYSVTVTDMETNCSGADTTFLRFDQTNYSLEAIGGFENRICQGEERTLTVDVANRGNLPRVNTEITVGYINGTEEPIYEQFTVGDSWEADEIQTFTFTSPVIFNNYGANTVKAFVDHIDDLVQSDDSLSTGVTVDASPIVDFGGDTLEVGIPYTLDAGDHATYQWQDNFDGRYYIITSPDADVYTVTVTDLNSTCITRQSVWVEPALSNRNTLPDNLEMELYPNPASEFLNIRAEELSGNEMYIELYSITNQLVWADFHDGYGVYENKLDISGFKEGVYLLRFRSRDVNYVQRLIIR